MSERACSGTEDRYVTDETARLESEGVCMKPPPGWRCTRAAGHDGPCAALPVASTHPPSPQAEVQRAEAVERYLDEAREPSTPPHLEDQGTGKQSPAEPREAVTLWFHDKLGVHLPEPKPGAGETWRRERDEDLERRNWRPVRYVPAPAEPQGDVVAKAAEILAERFWKKHIANTDAPTWDELSDAERFPKVLLAKDFLRVRLLPVLTPLLALEVRERLEGEDATLEVARSLCPDQAHWDAREEEYKDQARVIVRLLADWLSRDSDEFAPAPSEPEAGK